MAHAADATHTQATTFTVSLTEVNKLLELIERLFDGLSKASGLPKRQRREFQAALGDTCEMVASVLTIVKQRLSNLHTQVRQDGYSKSVQSQLLQLNNLMEWEVTYRNIRLCLPLRMAAAELRNGVFDKFVNYFAFRNTKQLKKSIEIFLKDEETLGRFVSSMLDDLSQLGWAHLVEQQVASKSKKKMQDYVLARLREARTSIHEYRDKFITMEIRIRQSI